jgi:Rrf2 family protein
MAILAALPPERTLQAQELADAGRIPIKFLEQILLVLKRAGLLRSKRGVGGGYRLGRESRLISVAGIVEAVDGELMCFLEEKGYPEFPGSRGIQRCLAEAGEATNRRFRETTLEDLIRPDVADSMVGYGI